MFDTGPLKYHSSVCLIIAPHPSIESLFLSLQMHSMTSSPSVPLQHTSRASSAVVYSVSSADTKQRKRGRKKKQPTTSQTRYTVALQGSVGNLIQGHTLTRNQLVLTKEFNSGIIDSDNQIRPWPVEFIFLRPHTVC